MTSHSVNESELALHLNPIGSAVTMLDNRLHVIQLYLEGVRTGQYPKNREILRRISCLCSTLPANDTPQFSLEFTREYNDTLLVAYLAALTKGIACVDDLSTKFNLSGEGKGRQRKHGRMVLY